MKSESEPSEARTHNLRRRMGCAPPKCENGEWRVKQRECKFFYFVITYFKTKF